jgi:hypothetical protein
MAGTSPAITNQLTPECRRERHPTPSFFCRLDDDVVY